MKLMNDSRNYTPSFFGVPEPKLYTKVPSNRLSINQEMLMGVIQKKRNPSFSRNLSKTIDNKLNSLFKLSY